MLTITLRDLQFRRRQFGIAVVGAAVVFGLTLLLTGMSAGLNQERSVPRSDLSEETARILFLTYGHDAVQMAVLRCTELTNAGDKAGLASWKKVLNNVRKLAAANPKQSGR